MCCYSSGRTATATAGNGRKVFSPESYSWHARCSFITPAAAAAVAVAPTPMIITNAIRFCFRLSSTSLSLSLFANGLLISNEREEWEERMLIPKRRLRHTSSVPICLFAALLRESLLACFSLFLVPFAPFPRSIYVFLPFCLFCIRASPLVVLCVSVRS